MSSPEARAIEVIDHIGNEPSNVIAAALATEGLLAPEPQIIRTREELDALDPDTVVTDGILTVAAGLAALYAQIGMLSLPAVVIATGDTARAARQALEDTDATD